VQPSQLQEVTRAKFDGENRTMQKTAHLAVTAALSIHAISRHWVCVFITHTPQPVK